MKKNTLILILLLVLIAAGVVVGQERNFFKKDVVPEHIEETPITETPEPTAPVVTPQTVTAKIGQEISVNGVTGKVTAVTEDSRCPATANCIWAGTVRVSATASYAGLSKNVTLTLGEPLTLGNHSITLIDVLPLKMTQPIAPGDYVFTFEIK